VDLSVIIINYNVKHFLEQCLSSVQRAISTISAEVIVIDNNSMDNSLDYLQPRFPQVRFIANKENAGFSKACNQGLKIATGDHILFLNPDTILPEDCLTECIAFLRSHPDAGALGIKMLDGGGRFLKESKRSFPSPLTSLYKLFGLAGLFPHSKTFAKYHLGHLNENENHEVDVLAGAFMMVKRAVLEKTGGFDEVFFMYGEDIDLSYRIQKSGFKNYYFAGSRIIHFKGESTKRGSMNYVRMFYNAMSLFVKKHYGGTRAGLFNFFIHLAIWIRAAMTAVGSFIRRLGLPMIDTGFILLSFWIIKNFWNTYIRPDTQYETRILWIVFPCFTLAYLVTAYYAGLYDRWYKRSELIRSTLIATVVILAAYSLLPERYRFSRGIILFGVVLAFILISLLRWALVKIKVLDDNKARQEHADTLIAGTQPEYDNILHLLSEAGMQEKVLGRVAVQEEDLTGIGHWCRLGQLSKVLPFREVIFCQGTLSFREIIAMLPEIDHQIKIKIHAAGSHSIVGSESKDYSGEALSRENGFQLADPYNLRLKRLADVCIALIALATFPIQLVIVKRPLQFLSNCIGIVFGRKTWIGYAVPQKGLPLLRPGILASNGIPVQVKQQLPVQSLQMIDYWYARDYEPSHDIKLILKTYRQLGG
jgi:O-antigen biosynthesis protein